ncbi:cytochrome c-type biogenesis protein [Celeribacter marinus]|uniref:Cytochrome c-type biogenesis protein n=1 Tax=Celeribacter marinus TaxID=1397108 RepID=A0A0N7HIA6_9RHOB|nr:cytochrome c-type biogenesis protein [Celeribacter marinus]ALI54685.1 cytochrome c heme lyase subunit CcmL [Celeribacter marinus]SFK53402.1 cytochrome c-type biogenesis protein CcmH [Celeribacter marinus]
MKHLILVLALVMGSTPAVAVQPDEVLPDTAMEERAREISKELRCLVCRNENIDESNADLAKDLRLLVRERLVEGDSNVEVVDYVVDRYGEYVLLKPTLTGSNKLLWIAGPLMLLAAFGVAIGFVRRRQNEAETVELTSDEQTRLDAIMKD